MAAKNKQAANGEKELIKMVGETQAKALDRAPSPHVGIIQIALLVAVISVLLGTGLIYKNQATWGFGAIVAGIAALGYAMYLIRPNAQANQEPSTQPTHNTIRGQWSRITVKLPIPQHQLNAFSGNLQTIRNLAQSRYTSLLRSRNPAQAADSSRIRANIFLPDTLR